MKARHFLLGATLLSAGLLLNAPLFAAVESDVVGYTTIQMDAGKWYMIGSPFVELDAAAAVTVNDVFSTGFSTGDELNIYNPRTGMYTTLTWFDYDGTAAWRNPMTGEYSTQALSKGQAVFINKKSEGDVTVKGKVSSEEIVTFGLPDSSSWSQVVCVYPVTMDVNDIQWDGLAEGDELHVYDSTSGMYNSSTWFKFNGMNAWRNPMTGESVSLKVAPGMALFVHKVQAGTGTCSPEVTIKE